MPKGIINNLDLPRAFYKRHLYPNYPVSESKMEAGTSARFWASVSPTVGLQFLSGELVGVGEMGPMPEGCWPAPMTTAFVSWGLRIAQGRVAPFLASGVENASVLK